MVSHSAASLLGGLAELMVTVKAMIRQSNLRWLVLVATLAMWSACWERASLQADAQTGPTSGATVGQVLPTFTPASDVCRRCHEAQFKSYLATAHHRTSQKPEEKTIAGHFTATRNAMNTVNPELSFRMDEHQSRFTQTATARRHGKETTRTETIDVVIGSATKGQTYLYWKGDQLFELPVSYWTELDEWINSPGYVDGSADFGRPVTPRCLECHTTDIEMSSGSPTDNRYMRNSLVLGISCQRCHGPALEHIRQHDAQPKGFGSFTPIAPVGLTRDRQMDICAQCHGGVGAPIAPSFTYTPGEQLDRYIRLEEPTVTDRLDVHGNQVALLKRSRCYQNSPSMTCSTCHNPHSPELRPAEYSTRCLTCHRIDNCGMFGTLGAKIAQNCIDCHMPVQASNSLAFDAGDSRIPAKVRNHWIRVYSRGTR